MPWPPTQSDPNRPLNARQQAFIDALMADPGRCQSRAALAAGYSPRRARESGYELLHSPKYAHVQKAYTEAAQRQAEQAAKVTKNDVYRFFKAQMFVDRIAVLQKIEAGQLDQLTDDERLVIENLKKVTLNDGSGDTITVPILADRQRAGIQMAKMMGLTVEKHEHRIDVTIEDARKRLSSKLARLSADRVSGSLPPGSDAGRTS